MNPILGISFVCNVMKQEKDVCTLRVFLVVCCVSIFVVYKVCLYIEGSFGCPQNPLNIAIGFWIHALEHILFFRHSHVYHGDIFWYIEAFLFPCFTILLSGLKYAGVLFLPSSLVNSVAADVYFPFFLDNIYTSLEAPNTARIYFEYISVRGHDFYEWVC